MSDGFVITSFVSALMAHDKKGRKTEYASRYASAFIFTKKGRIRFSCGGQEVFADSDHAVFLPEGSHYVNECLEDAESIVINFRTLHSYPTPLPCRPLPYDVVMEHFKKIQEQNLIPSLQGYCQTMEILYFLASQLFSTKSEQPSDHPLITQALAFMTMHCGDSELTVTAVARHCHISDVYLRKLFARELHLSPRQKLTELRMEKARLLAKEKRAIKEIAASVGYADVFQFSRAYKKHFGHAPSRE